MVLHKRLDYGFSGYQVPIIPHVPKSARRKRSARKKVEENKMCAFDLLATVAGQLLTEGTGTPFPTAGNDNVKEDPSVRVNSIRTVLLDQYSCSDGLLHSEIVPKGSFSYDIKEQSHAAEILASELAQEKFDISNKDTIVKESIVDHGSESKCLLSATPEKYNSERHPSSSIESHKYTEVVKTPTPAERRMVGNVMDVNTPDLYNLEDPMDMDIKPPALVSSDSSAEVPAYRNNLPRNSSFPKYGHGLELAIDKDDDENSSGCTHPCFLTNKPSRLQRIGDHKIRKHSSSKYWNVYPTVAREKGLSSYDVVKKPVFHGKKMSYMCQRPHRGPFKRKKVLECCPVPKGEVYHEIVSSLCQKSGIKLEQSDSNATFHGGSKSSSQSSEYSVKLSISSFKIPELFIEMSETATVASLKKTVAEAVTAILGGGLRVGVLLQGRKVRDDNKTLRQAGILHSDKLDNLGFMLEPDSTHVSPPLMASEDIHLPSLTTPNKLSDRIVPISTAPIVEVGADVSPQPLVTIRPESDHDSIYSPADASCLDKPTSNSQALVVIPPINSDSMAVIPLRKSRRSEVAQRRIRRPFSVTEVEALVQAVEMLGTGRWRDVKLRAFDNAKHRTYVDLKDKWKTLVHTARISPQQRRGEPVPQELLDRVLAAHAYWSQQQAKLQIKPPTSETLLLI